MSAEPKPRMSVDEFLAWAEDRPGRYEFDRGRVVAMAPERAGHARMKFAVQAALAAAIRRGSLPCEMFPDGMTVRIDRDTAYEPDALVRCGALLDADAIEVSDPIVVVEVASPSTKAIDNGVKLSGYFLVPSVRHHLLVDPGRRLVVHHRRGGDARIETRIVTDGTLTLDPPGIRLALAELFEGL